jgi:mannose-6-phosphate isomerase
VGGGRERPAGLECAAHIPTPQDGASAREVAAAVGAYAELYGRALAAEARRRADSEHDRRPWGEYWVLADTPGYKVKRIDVLPGKRLSYQRHAQRAEHWVVVSGRALVTLDGVERELGSGESIDVPLGAAHRVANPGPGLLSIIEVQHGSYFGEDDIERLADDFGR